LTNYLVDLESEYVSKNQNI